MQDAKKDQSPAPAAAPAISEKPATRIPVLSATIILIAVNILAFFASLIYSAHVAGSGKFMDTSVGSQINIHVLLDCGADYGPKTLAGQYWRVVTALFLHLNWRHLAVNICCLFPICVLLETWLRRQSVIAIYVIAGVGGSLLAMFLHPSVISVGSSGAIFGLSGALISLIAFSKVSFPGFRKASVLLWMIGAALFFLWLGHSSPRVDNASHMGGLLTGLLLGGLLARSFRREIVQPVTSLWRPLAAATAIMAVLFAAVALLRTEVREISLGDLALKNNNNAAAVVHFQKYLAMHPNDITGRMKLGETYAGMEKPQEAAAEYRRVLEIDPDNTVIQYELGEIYFIAQRLDEAIPLWKKSVPKLPPDEGKYYDLALALLLSGQVKEAEQYARTAVTLDAKSIRNQALLNMILDRIAVTEHNGGTSANEAKPAH